MAFPRSRNLQAQKSMQESRQLATIQPNPFRLESITHQWTPGETVADILAAVDYDDRHWSGARVFLNDQLIDPQYYHVVRPHADVIIAIKVMPEGGDNSMLRTVAFIALAVAVSMIPGAQGWRLRCRHPGDQCDHPSEVTGTR